MTTIQAGSAPSAQFQPQTTTMPGAAARIAALLGRDACSFYHDAGEKAHLAQEAPRNLQSV
jgi:hypothetical protein